jgi:hypothetical protein
LALVPRSGISAPAPPISAALIPPLALAEARRAAATRSLAGDLPARYATVFPLGMYAVATDDAHRVIGGEPLAALAGTTFWIALAAWLLVRAGLAIRPASYTDRGG